MADGTCGTWVPPASSSANPLVGGVVGISLAEALPLAYHGDDAGGMSIHSVLGPPILQGYSVECHREDGWLPAGQPSL